MSAGRVSERGAERATYAFSGQALAERRVGAGQIRAVRSERHCTQRAGASTTEHDRARAWIRAEPKRGEGKGGGPRAEVEEGGRY